MPMLAIDAFLLIVLIKAFNGQEMSFGTASFIALFTALGKLILLFVLATETELGAIGALATVPIAAALLGVVLSAWFEVEVRRSVLIGAAFTAFRFLIDAILLL